MRDYDVAIIGGGIGGLMTAYEISENDPACRVVILEKGSALPGRHCPIIEKKTGKCVRCKSCAVMEGMAGAGAFSDGKYIISTEYGGWLTEFLEPETVLGLIEKADSVLVRFGANTDRFLPDNELKTLCLQHDLHMQQASLKHLGTDANYETMRRLIEHIAERVDIMTDTRVEDVGKDDHVIRAVGAQGELALRARHIVFAVGRAGSGYLSAWCRNNGIELVNNQVDVGVRVELPAVIWDHFSKRIYEPKIWYRSKLYGDTTRMFCFNERGCVVTENTDGVLTVNGHAYKSAERKTENSNFALLSTTRFTEPFREPINYARYVASLSNLISGGSVLVQRLGDLEAGRRTNAARLANSTTRPTLDAVPGDLSLCMPMRQLDNIIETLHALDKVAPGTANHDTLLYGVECKYYSARPACEDFALVGCERIYAVGDGAGFTRSLSHAAANGLYVGDKILREK
ncbi:NAD(P)/FAD-dependent oxidoreductase [Feifania hominis]|uniref:NAD(P)-binding protein n=1 Tax=Feifania hominis TaxID=2763660 RepID=A0A926DA22_9FIRM|nr:NAD(P)-binding protein [Feifania hominis]MBC8535165.1 NAD(P)-binding protein [Feifania hominis]